MADFCDEAEKQSQHYLDAALANINANFSIEGNGECLYCGEAVEPTVVNGKSIVGRWCDSSCREEWSSGNGL
jgi:hypothetical protein